MKHLSARPPRPREPAHRLRTGLTLAAIACIVGAYASPRMAAPGAPTPVAADAAALPSLKPMASLQELMQSVVDPSADGVWNAVETVTSRAGTEERQPRTAEAWSLVRNAAITLAESTNLLLLEGRRVATAKFPAEAKGALDSVAIAALIDAQRPVFNGYVVALRGAAAKAIAAIDARDPEGMVKAGGEIDAVCEACHFTFWYPNQVIPTLPAASVTHMQPVHNHLQNR